MEITMKRSVKMLVLFALCAAMMLAVVGFTAGDALAQTYYDVDFLNASGTAPSMADAAIAGDALYDDVELTIPLQVISRVMGGVTYYGYIDSLQVDITGDGEYDITVEPDETPYYPENGSISIPLDPSLVESGAQFAVYFGIDLYDDEAGTDPADMSHTAAPAILYIN